MFNPEPLSIQKTSRPRRLCIVGLWHQACVLSACFAEMGHQVMTAGEDASVVSSLSEGQPPVHEPGLDALLARNLEAGRLRFTTNYGEALNQAEFVFISIDTPVNDRDEPELQSLLDVAQKIGRFRSGDVILCVTSQVPVGTCERLVSLVREQKTAGECDVAYIPEFLRLGEAVETFYRADRFLIGARAPLVAERVAELYRPLNRPIVMMGLRSAEMAKHACNSYLATSISFMNEISTICELVGADAVDVARAMKLDRRVGPFAFLSPGLGFAGGTLGRDVRALQAIAHEHTRSTPLMDAVIAVNEGRVEVLQKSLLRIYQSLVGVRIGILGLTYKSGTSTLRRSVALEVIARLVEAGAEVRAYDPLADLTSAGPLPRFINSPDPYSLAEECDGLILVTEWAGILDLDLTRLRAAMRRPVFIDTRNLFDPARMAQLGFIYQGLGRGGLLSPVAGN